MKSLLVLALVFSGSALAQAASADGSFRQTSRLSVARPIVEKLREIKSVSDWGARCDGTSASRQGPENPKLHPPLVIPNDCWPMAMPGVAPESPSMAMQWQSVDQTCPD